MRHAGRMKAPWTSHQCEHPGDIQPTKHFADPYTHHCTPMVSKKPSAQQLTAKMSNQKELLTQSLVSGFLLAGFSYVGYSSYLLEEEVIRWYISQ